MPSNRRRNENPQPLNELQMTSQQEKRGYHALTIPISPHLSVARRQRGVKEVQLKRMQEDLERYQMERQRAERRKEQALYGAPMLPSRCDKQLTQPEDFDFPTYRRLGPPLIMTATTNTIQSKNELNGNHEDEVRSNIPLSNTIPEPFHFRVDQLMKSRNTRVPTRTVPVPLTPLAEKILKIQNATPEHWKRIPKKPSPIRELSLTLPVDPLLHTSIRMSNKPPVKRIPSPDTTFKALPLNRKILESVGDLGVPRINKRPPTLAFSPKLHVSQRLLMRSMGNVNSNMELEGCTLKRNQKPGRRHEEEWDPMKLTVPQSPFLLTRERSNMHLKVEKRSPSSPSTLKFKARPMPDMNHVMMNDNRVKDQKPLTIPQPFALKTEQRAWVEEQKRLELEKRLKEEMEPQKFHARPMPVPEFFHPALELKFTEFSPFHLESVSRHEESYRKFRSEAEMIENERLKKMEFHARPFQKGDPIPIVKSSKPLTEVSDFVLNSERRAWERNSFEAKKQQKELALQKANKERELIMAERQREQIKRIRAQMVHKARGIPSSLYIQPPAIKSSDKPLTEPKTPNLKTKRLRAGRDI